MNVVRLKAAVRARDGFRCVKCGMTNHEHLEATERQLEVHRVIPGSVYSLDGCVTLCRACHGPQPRRKRGQPDLGYNGWEMLGVSIDPDLDAALSRYLAAAEPRTSKAAVVRYALTEFLRSHGHWPPKD
jgi:hypothetical protein